VKTSAAAATEGRQLLLADERTMRGVLPDRTTAVSSCAKEHALPCLLIMGLWALQLLSTEPGELQVLVVTPTAADVSLRPLPVDDA
jgi:hypothetical protein